ncbi:phosphoadenosine phosphosulfate reductase [Candidatus Bathyarchaeota archaeon]|nr:phosphoadenosine phosphosulfate reductase [Candidatus Bathyarchaeota archaeon]
MEMQIEKHVFDELSDKSREAGMKPHRYLKQLLAARHKKRVDMLPLNAKAEIAKIVSSEALRTFKKPAVSWSGGKDSTLVLHLAQQVAEKLGRRVEAIFVDDLLQMPETYDFVEKISDEWGVKLHKEKFGLLKDYEYGEDVLIEGLPKRIQVELEKLGHERPSFRFSMDDLNTIYLLKVVALYDGIRKLKLDAILRGIRWDENLASAGETFFRKHAELAHFEVHPILPFTERDVWDYSLKTGIPTHPIYKKGFRTFGNKYESKKAGARPAWEQDLSGRENRI